MPSKNPGPRLVIYCRDEQQKRRLERAAEITGRSASSWARYHLDRAASLDLQQHGIREDFPAPQSRAS